jgi:hypothetical protein
MSVNGIDSLHPSDRKRARTAKQSGWADALTRADHTGRRRQRVVASGRMW